MLVSTFLAVMVASRVLGERRILIVIVAHAPARWILIRASLTRITLITALVASSTSCALDLLLGMQIKLILALLDLVIEKLVDPHSHLDVVLQHHHDHAVEGEAQVILLDGELLELFLKHSQLLRTLLDQIE